MFFVGIPLFELYWLIKVGAEIGAIPTVFLVVFTAVLGGLLVRMQGFSTALRVRGSMERGEVPAIEMMEGAVLLVCGIMLLLPGFFTDLIGFLGLVPPIRLWLVMAILKKARVIQPPSHRREPETPPSHRIIDGDFRREDDDG
jgi:UPF0716 protein FxsA